ncbi:MAG: transposase, partial [Candidatus Berkelbacteria bacterium]|nr:transposase [Candidatus Berkelbacteria bacterium]
KHYFQDNSIYFLTARTVEGQWFLQPDSYKEILSRKIQDKTEKFGYKLLAYVILHNHYHLLIQVADSSKLAKFMTEINGSSAREINKADHAIDRKIWWNYFDHIIRDESDFFKHLNYIHQNPIKHGVSKEFDYKFSSYHSWLEKKGKEYLDQAFEQYPIVDFVSQMDEF